jgi:PIN domain nuclease of toxin-antitoxin system
MGLVLRDATRALGLSSGDRACLALAQSLGAVALTADRSWSRLNLDIAIEVIR